MASIKIPEYGASQTSRSPVSGPRMSNASPDVFGVAAQGGERIGQAAANVGDALAKLGVKVAETEAEDAFNKYQEEMSRMKYEGETAYFNTRGKVAYDNSESFINEAKKVRQRYSDKLGHQARDLFDRASETDMARTQEDVFRHASAQYAAWEQETMKARAENVLRFATMKWDKPDELAAQLEVGLSAVASLNQSAGEEAVDSAKADFKESFYKNILNSATTASPEMARYVMASIKQHLTPETLMSAETRIKAREKEISTQQNAVNSISMATRIVEDIFSSGLKTNDIRNTVIDRVYAETKDKPELQDATMREAMNRVDIRMRADQEEQMAIYDTVLGYMKNNITVEQFKAAQPEAWNKLTEAQKLKLENPGEAKTDLNEYYRLMSLPADQLAKIDIADYTASFEDKHLNALFAEITKARNGDPMSQVGRTQYQMINDMATQIYGKEKGSSASEANAANKNTFFKLVGEEVAFRQRPAELGGLGRRLNDKEFTQLLNDMAVKVSIPGKFFGTNDLGLNEIPAAAVSAISRDLHEAGQPASAANIIEAYNSPDYDYKTLYPSK